MKYINAERHQTALHSSKYPLTAYDCATSVFLNSHLKKKILGNQLCSWDIMCLELNFPSFIKPMVVCPLSFACPNPPKSPPRLWAFATRSKLATLVFPQQKLKNLTQFSIQSASSLHQIFHAMSLNIQEKKLIEYTG